MSTEEKQELPFNPVSENEFASIDFELPLEGNCTVGYFDLSQIYVEARVKAEADDKLLEANAYALLSIVCRFHSKPEDRAEPYGPMFVSGDGRRSLIPSDFRGEQAEVFGKIAGRTKNPALRARLADVAWLNRRSDVISKTHAINGLNESVRRVLSGEAHFDGGQQEAHIWLGVKYLQRALSIARTRGTDPAAEAETKALLVRMRTTSAENKDPSIFGRATKLDLRYGISDVGQIASEAMAYADFEEARKNEDGARRCWLLAAEAYEIARDVAQRAQCLTKAAECYAREAMALGGSAMNATSAFMQAIEQYREVPRQYRPPDRLEQLQAMLVAKQAEIHDEMGVFEQAQDITEEVNKVINAYSRKPLADCLLGLAFVGEAKGIEAYREEIRASAEEFSFASVIDTTVHDDEGKVVSRIPALDLSGNISDEDVRLRCAQNMGFEHQAGVQGVIRPVLHVIMSEHSVHEEMFYILAQRSPFVPSGHESAYALGFSKFFAGASMEACCLLVPQLENSLRHVLKLSGLDVTKITNSSTQEDVMMSVLLDRFREPLEKIFGAPMMFQIEMIFQSKSGFNIRNSLAHGTTKDHQFWSATHIYACWLMYKLMMHPLASRWSETKAVLQKERFI